jgi:hypothetical protein
LREKERKKSKRRKVCTFVDGKNLVGRTGHEERDNLVRQNQPISVHEISRCWLHVTILLHSFTNFIRIYVFLVSDIKSILSVVTPHTRSTISGEDRDNITPHNAIKANTTTTIFVGIFLAIAYKSGFYSHLCCFRWLTNVESDSMRREISRTGIAKHTDSMSQKRREEVVKRWHNKRLEAPRQGQLDGRATGSGGIADFRDEELTSYRSAVAAGRFVSRVGGSSKEGTSFE